MLTIIDLQILNFIQRKTKCRLLDFLMPKLTLLGNLGMVWIAIAFVLMVNENYENAGEQIIVGLAIGVMVGNIILKHIFARPRPCWIRNDIDILIKNPKDYSFPSGHTLSSVIATVLLINNNTLLGLLAIIISCIIIFSRMYLFVHYPSDILGGAAIGIAISQLVMKLV